MVDVRLEYPEDVELVFRNSRLSSVEILDEGWKKLTAAGWPERGQPVTINLTIEQHRDGNVTVLVSAEKH